MQNEPKEVPANIGKVMVRTIVSVKWYLCIFLHFCVFFSLQFQSIPSVFPSQVSICIFLIFFFFTYFILVSCLGVISKMATAREFKVLPMKINFNTNLKLKESYIGIIMNKIRKAHNVSLPLPVCVSIFIQIFNYYSFSCGSTEG